MRNAATFDDDLVDYGPARKGAPRKRRGTAPAAKAKKGTKRPRFDMHRVARFAAIGMAATMALGIMVNALVLQKGHHPSPLFGKASPVNATQPPAPLPPIRAAQAVHTDAAPATIARAPKNVTTAVQGGSKASPDDPIGRLLAGGPASGGKAAVQGEAKGEGKTVMGVQRALNKLGFRVPATGAAGPVTKKAIQAFEKDRHMAVKGEVDRRLVKVLAAESGIKIE